MSTVTKTSILSPACFVDSLTSICHYLSSQSVLSLCCQRDGNLWCASCFYLFEPETMSFIFMTDLKSRHGQMMLDEPKVAGAISSQDSELINAKGVQFSGKSSLLIGSQEEKARRRYYERFPILKVIPFPFWRLHIDEIILTDNSVRYAFRQRWVREE